jgi:hypothetical protein
LLRVEGFHRRDIVNRKKIALRAAFSRKKFFREAKMGADQRPPKLYVTIHHSVPLLCFPFYLDEFHDAPLMAFIVSRRLNTFFDVSHSTIPFPLRSHQPKLANHRNVENLQPIHTLCSRTQTN